MPSIAHVHPEIGRQLSVAELIADTIVVLRKPGKPYALTVWAEFVGENLVAFYAGGAKPPFTLILLRQPDGSMQDDSGDTIEVYEFLGETQH